MDASDNCIKNMWNENKVKKENILAHVDKDHDLYASYFCPLKVLFQADNIGRLEEQREIERAQLFVPKFQGRHVSRRQSGFLC